MNLINIIRAEPVAIAGAFRAVLWSLVLLQIIVLNEAQLAGIAIAVEAVLTLFVRQNTYAPDTVQALANAATYQAPGTTVDIGSPPDASPPLPG